MTDRKQPDPNQVAARVLREATAKHEQPLPADVEAAWAQWSGSIQHVDQRTLTLLRAAFEAGVASAFPAPQNGAAALGRLGGLKGGKARAAALSPAKRKAIAKKAAAKRWGHSATGG